MMTTGSILATIAMTISVHIPKPLLKALDRKARALKISRNRLIVRALERELALGADWSQGFFERLSAIDHETAAAADELLASVHQARKSKQPKPRLLTPLVESLRGVLSGSGLGEADYRRHLEEKYL
jgi:predicted transcriptional regulator